MFRFLGKSALVALFCLAISAGLSARAATVTSANDVVSTLQTSTAANHTLIFTTPSGALEGETITVSFDSAFDTSSLTENDVDISDDSTDLTTSTDCTGADQAAVTIAADVLTIEICPGNGGAIAATSVIEIQIGDQATADGIGINQVINPSSAGTYYVSIAGTFGDSGSIALPIGSSDTISVTATVAGGGGGGGGGGIPGGGGGGGGDEGGGQRQADVSPPRIENVTVSQVTETSAVISWNTDEPSTSFIDLGLDVTYEFGAFGQPDQVVRHAVTLLGLRAGVNYHFRARSTDISANQAVTGDFSFTTLDLTPPLLSGVQVVDITKQSARIVWQTNEPTTSVVKYGLSIAYTNGVDINVSEQVHSQILSGLTHSTRYHFRIYAIDAFGNESSTSDQVFTTLADAPPANVQQLSVVAGNRQNVLSWQNPQEEDLLGVRVLACTQAFPVGSSDPRCQQLTNGLTTSFTHTGLVNEQTYFYGVFAFDRAMQFASGALGVGTPRESEEELPDEEAPEVPPHDQPPVDPVQNPVDPLAGEGQPDGGSQGSVCGDSVCEESENARVCPKDCAQQELPQKAESESDDSVQTIEDQALADHLSFLVASHALVLQPVLGNIRLLSAAPVRVVLYDHPRVAQATHVRLTIADQVYLMSPNFSHHAREKNETSEGVRDAYQADIFSPDRLGMSQVQIEIFEDITQISTLRVPLEVVSLGSVTEFSKGVLLPVEQAQVILEDEDRGLVWDGSPYGQQNPVLTDGSGLFGWYVPNGTYRVRVQREGYKDVQRSSLIVTDQIVRPTIRLVRKDEVVAVQVEQSPKSTSERSVAAVKGAATAVINTARQTLETIREVPGITEAAVVSVPTLAVTATATTVTLAVAFDFLPFLQYLFSAPVLFFARRKRRGFGVVYNAITKLPIDLAIVRLYERLPNGRRRLVRSRVTDKGGRYLFLADPGIYELSVTKQQFSFPSSYLKNVKEDGRFLDVYHSEAVEVKEKGVVIGANIPLDPMDHAENHTPKKLIWMARLRVVQHFVAYSGVVASIAFSIIRPSMLAVAMVGVQLIVLLLVKRLASPRKPKSWGVVYDKETGKPLARAVVRIFEPLYNKLLESQVTDAQGRYSFLLGPNTYYASYEHPGFKAQEVRPIDYSQSNEPKEFGKRIDLEHESRA